MAKDRDEKMVERCCAQLMEHFDSVQIFVTRHEGDITMSGATGHGNFYARYGQVQEWLCRQDAIITESASCDDEEDFEVGEVEDD